MASLSATTNLYDVLGVSKTASEDEIKQAFKKKAQQSHPDKGGDRAVFESVQQAYENLTNPQKRRTYDRFGNAGLKMSPGEMLHSAFTGDSPVPETETPVSNSLSQRLVQLERQNAELQNKVQLYQKESHVMTHEGGFEAWLRNNKVRPSAVPPCCRAPARALNVVLSRCFPRTQSPPVTHGLCSRCGAMWVCGGHR